MIDLFASGLRGYSSLVYDRKREVYCFPGDFGEFVIGCCVSSGHHAYVVDF
jgi:hypothetical protein